MRGDGIRVAIGVACVLAALLPAPARAAALPRYDLDSYCRKMSGLSGGANGTLFSACRRSETRARDALATRWDRLPEDKQAYCDELSRSAGFGRYARLRSCVDRQLAAAERPRRRRR